MTPLPPTSTPDVLDENLERLAATGPEYAGGLTSHAPMVAEALVCLGRAELVEPWVSGYLPRLDGPPRGLAPIARGEWHRALGRRERVADWTAYFRRAIAEDGWRPVAARWWPRLLPGVAAGATHGIIRTAHALRSVAAVETSRREAELATALAYWAADHTRLPGNPRTAGTRTLREAIDALPLAPGDVRPGLIRDRLAGLDVVPHFAQSVAELHPPRDPAPELAALVTAFARIFLTHGHRWPTAFAHAVTAPAAAHSVLPHLPPDQARPTHDAMWQLCAGLYAVHARGTVPQPLPDTAPPEPAELIERAVANGDEHAVKLTEACLRTHRARPDPLLLHAAARGVRLLPEPL